MNLFMDFESKGTWWIPEKPDDKLGGSLKFKHNNCILLELNGLFKKKSTFPLLKPELILGVTSEGKEVTLFQSYESDFSEPVICVKSSSSERIGRQSFICKYMFVGKHFNRPEDMIFKGLGTNFTYLDQWLNNTFKFDKMSENEYRIEVNSIKSELKIDSMSTTLTIWSWPDYTGSFPSGSTTGPIGIKYNSGITIKPDEPMNLKWFESFIYNLGNLLTLLIGCPVYPTNLYGEGVGADHDYIDIYYIIENPRYMKDFRFLEMDNRYPELIKYSNRSEQRIADVINNWFKKLELLGPVYDLIAITFYDSSMYSRTYFLTLMQAIETFHRKVIGGNYQNKTDYKPTRQALVKAIPEGLDEKFKEVLENKIQHLNEFTLRDRLDDLKNCSVGDFKFFESIMGKDPDIIKKLADTRNYQTHFGRKTRSIFGDDELPQINYELRLFLRVLLLDQIDSGSILDTMGICTRYRR